MANDKSVKATVDMGQLLLAIVQLVALFKNGRDEVIGKGDPTGQGGILKTDQELIALFSLEATDALAHVNDLIIKHGGTPVPSTLPTIEPKPPTNPGG